MATRDLEYKPLLYTTTVRNPERVKSLLNILVQFDGQTLTDELATRIVAETIRYGLYRPVHNTTSIKEKYGNTPKGTFAKQILTDSEVQYIITNNPQQHKEAGFDYGYPSRFATIFDFTKELGFVYFNPNEPIQFSALGHMLSQVYHVTVAEGGDINVEIVHPEYEQQAFMQSLAKSQRKNPFVRVLNDNIPLILLAQVIKLLNANPEYRTESGKTKGIARHELPLLIFWKDNNAESLYNRIVQLRNEYAYSPSEEHICDICINEIMNGFKEFKQKSIMSEYPDEFIRKMRITGLFSLRGAGRFLDINYNEEEKINYILQTYSSYEHHENEREYFDYMAEIDPQLFEVESIQITANQSEQLLNNWLEIYSWEDIKREMLILQKRASSRDSVLKLLAAPTRLEFLTALSIKSQLPHVRVIPNYACDDTGLPTSTAGGGKGDIECYEYDKGILVEVTMAEGRTQTMMEVWPIDRHLGEFIENNNIEAQAIFIAPSIFHDSQMQINYVRATNQHIIRPYQIDDFLYWLDSVSMLWQ